MKCGDITTIEISFFTDKIGLLLKNGVILINNQYCHSATIANHGEKMTHIPHIRIFLLRLLALALWALPIAASAEQAVTSKPVNLRSGPGRDYPLVAGVGPGTPVNVMGCISDYSWCDVQSPNGRGWIYANNLSYPYQGNNVPIYGYGTMIGLPIIAFSIATYWGNNYRNRPWFKNQSQWANRPHRPVRPIRPGPPPRPNPGARPPPRPKPPGNGGGFGGNRPGFGQGGQHGGNRPQQARPKPGGNGGQRGGRPQSR